jgi:hypothetical protein
MNWDMISRSVVVAVVLAAASVFSEAAMAQSDGSDMCWVNTGTGKVFGGASLPALPAGTTETSPGQRSGDGHEYSQVPCPPPGLPQPPARNRPAPAPEQ